jgi:hypothetical protein
MLTVSNAYFSSALELWDVRAKKVSHVFWVAGNFVVAAADAEHAAFTVPSCARPACPVKVALLKTREVISVAMPTGWATGASSFSPDGAKLAVVGRRVSRSAPDEPYLLIADLRTGAVRQADGLAPGTPRPSLLSWSPDGRWFFVASDAPGVSLLGYRVGDRRVRYAADALLRQMQPADVRSLSAY